MRENLTSGSMRGGCRDIVPDQSPTLPIRIQAARA